MRGTKGEGRKERERGGEKLFPLLGMIIMPTPYSKNCKLREKN